MLLFKASGVYRWASETLPIPAYPDTEIESLFSLSNAVLLNGSELDRTIDAHAFRFVVREMLNALSPGSPGYPPDPPFGKAPYTLDVGRETIPVWDDCFLFAGKLNSVNHRLNKTNDTTLKEERLTPYPCHGMGLVVVAGGILIVPHWIEDKIFATKGRKLRQ